MIIEILAFGIAKEIFRDRHISIELADNATVESVKQLLEEKYPGLKALGTYRVAVNREYAPDEQTPVHAEDEIAVIPPVSGG